MMAPPPIPCSALNIISFNCWSVSSTALLEVVDSTWSIVRDKAQAREKIQKMTRAEMRTCFLPKTSLQRPYSGVHASLRMRQLMLTKTASRRTR
jgi:hypothetical protein